MCARSVVHALELPGHVGDGVVKMLRNSVLRGAVAHEDATVPVASPRGDKCCELAALLAERDLVVARVCICHGLN